MYHVQWIALFSSQKMATWRTNFPHQRLWVKTCGEPILWKIWCNFIKAMNPLLYIWLATPAETLQLLLTKFAGRVLWYPPLLPLLNSSYFVLFPLSNLPQLLDLLGLPVHEFRYYVSPGWSLSAKYPKVI